MNHVHQAEYFGNTLFLQTEDFGHVIYLHHGDGGDEDGDVGHLLEFGLLSLAYYS